LAFIIIIVVVVVVKHSGLREILFRASLLYFVDVQILHPIDITLFSKDNIAENEHRVDITVTDVILNISPGSVRTITATLSSIGGPKVKLIIVLCLTEFCFH